jgi:tRNA(Ile)-lysidine synthase
LELRVGYETLTIADQDALHLPPEAPWLADEMRVELPVPGKVCLPEGWTVRMRYASYWNLDIIAENVNPFVAWLDADAVGEAPSLRTRQEGDRFQPHGMDGSTVRLSDFLINQKVPLRWRDYLPLLVADGKILWVVGMRLDESALVRPETERVVYVRFRGSRA